MHLIISTHKQIWTRMPTDMCVEGDTFSVSLLKKGFTLPNHKISIIQPKLSVPSAPRSVMFLTYTQDLLNELYLHSTTPYFHVNGMQGKTTTHRTRQIVL